MVKRYMSNLLLLALLIFMVSLPALAEKQENFEKKLSPQYLEYLTDKYLDNIGVSGILSKSWNNGDQIPSSFLLTYYNAEMLTSETKWVDGMAEIPATKVEQFLQSRFDVSVAHLRQSEQYNKGNKTYTFIQGIGGGGTLEAYDVSYNDGILTLYYTLISGDKMIFTGSLKLCPREDNPFFESCVHNSVTPSGKNPIELNLEYQSLLEPFCTSEIVIGDSMTSPQDIPPEKLVNFYRESILAPQNQDGWEGTKMIPATLVESFLQDTFDVTTEHLRKAPQYQQESQTYHFIYQQQKNIPYITDATRTQEDNITLTFEIRPAPNMTIGVGTITFRQDNGKMYYLSSNYKNDRSSIYIVDSSAHEYYYQRYMAPIVESGLLEKAWDKLASKDLQHIQPNRNSQPIQTTLPEKLPLILLDYEESNGKLSLSYAGDDHALYTVLIQEQGDFFRYLSITRRDEHHWDYSLWEEDYTKYATF